MDPLLKKISFYLPIILIFSYFVMIFQAPWQSVFASKDARDYASYHYAMKAAWDGDNPYQTKNLHHRARIEKTRSNVHPFFYPPPALLSMVWMSPLSLSTGYRAFFLLNQVLLLLCFWRIHKWLRTPWWFLSALALLFTPLTNSMKMGQINIWILLLLVFGLSRNSGVILGYAAMSKMSPALLFFQWIAQRNWKPALLCAVSVPFFSVMVLPLVDLEAQLFFYLEILPQFSSGAYHGLSVPIDLPANHSIPDLFNQVWPSESRHRLSSVARKGASLVNLSLFSILLVLSAIWRTEKSKQYLYGAMVALFLIFPVYCYEHHLALMLLPIVLVFRFYKKSHVVFKLAYLSSLICLALPLGVIRYGMKQYPSFSWVIQELKFFSIVSVLVLCVVAAYLSYREDRSVTSSSSSDGVK